MPHPQRAGWENHRRVYGDGRCRGGGAVDELSLLLAPAADGDPNAVTVFERSPLLPPSAPVTFQLKKVEELGNSVVRLVYTANNRMENEA